MTAKNIDEYVAAGADRARPILRKIRSIVRVAAPDAVGTISYGIPTFKLGGKTLVHLKKATSSSRWTSRSRTT